MRSKFTFLLVDSQPYTIFYFVIIGFSPPSQNKCDECDLYNNHIHDDHKIINDNCCEIFNKAKQYLENARSAK